MSESSYIQTGNEPTDTVSSPRILVVSLVPVAHTAVPGMRKEPLTSPLASSPSPHLLRLALGIVFFHFGFLKFFPDLSPAEMIASQTIMQISGGGLDARTAMWWLALLECAIGLGILFNVGLRFVSALKREVTNRMADFNAILDYPPAPKLDPLMRLNPELASEDELRGEALFHG